MKKSLWSGGLLSLLAVPLGSLAALDRDKAPLFSTFYSEGTGGPWVLALNAERKFQLTAPDGKSSSGDFVASNRELGLLGEGVVRHFEWSVEEDNLTLIATGKDGPRAGVRLGELPPTRVDGKAIFWSAQEWLKRQMERPAAAAKPDEAWRAQAPAAVEALRGEYVFRDTQNRSHALSLRADTTFEYTAPDGTRTVGLYTCERGELKLESRTHRRQLGLAKEAGGWRVQRLAADSLRLRDPLGEMPPLDLLPVAWAWTTRTPAREEAQDPWDFAKPRIVERADAGGTVEEQVVALVRSNRPEEAARRIQTALQQNPRSLRLQLLRDHLTSLLTGDAAHLGLRSICTRGAQAADEAMALSTKDTFAGPLKESLLGRERACAKLAADARERFFRDPGADPRGRPDEFKEQARLAAAELAKAQEAYLKKARDEEQITGVKVPILGNIGLKGETVKSRAWHKLAATLGGLRGEAVDLGR